MPGWDVDDQVADLAAANGLQMLDDRVDVKARNELGRGLDHVPRHGHKVTEAAGTDLGLDLNQGVRSSQECL